jgi:hypothetical protein
MIAWGKLMVAAMAPLMLTGCLWGPGNFNSELALRKNGSFVLDYRGEVVLQMPDDKEAAAEPWDDKMARCYRDGRTETVPLASAAENADDEDEELRSCTPAELAKLKADYQQEAAQRAQKKREESENMAKMFGLPGSDDASNRRFAATLMKYQGWRSVRYVGKGVFDVDYHFEGRLTQDYVFPMMPDSDIIIPFITLRRRNDGTVMATAPALTGGSGPFGARAKMMGLPDKGSDGPVSHAEGRFTISTDGEILTNNSEDGPVPHPTGRQVHWDVGPGSDKIPEMLVRL